MSDFSGKQILVLGRVQSVSDDEATITSADGTTITVGLDQNTSCCPLNNGSWYQFKGRGESPTRMREMTHTKAGNGSVDVDVESYIKLCEMWNGSKSDIFSGSKN